MDCRLCFEELCDRWMLEAVLPLMAFEGDG